tara:strand:- start:18337 stop:18561 length:225 start_codon:yes stop_codon:yes gene_type:complete
VKATGEYVLIELVSKETSSFVVKDNFSIVSVGEGVPLPSLQPMGCILCDDSKIMKVGKYLFIHYSNILGVETDE